MLEDQVLIDARSHSYFENVLSEDEVLVYTSVLENLIKINRKIDETDIMNEFKKFGNNYLWLADNWFSEPNFKDNLALFNDRKEDIKKMSMDEWILTHYKTAYSRFYENILKDKRLQICSLISKHYPNLDISDIINMQNENDYIKEFTKVFIEIMNQYGYPIKI